MVLYIRQMKHRNRVIPFFDESNYLNAIVTYFIVDDFKINRSNLWSMVKENPEGKYIFLDRLITNKKVGISNIKKGISDIVKFVNQKYPDKKIVWQSRRGYEIHLKNN